MRAIIASLVFVVMSVLVSALTPFGSKVLDSESSDPASESGQLPGGRVLRAESDSFGGNAAGTAYPPEGVVADLKSNFIFADVDEKKSPPAVMDPNDESTLPVRTERISIGPRMDPNDESTLPVRTERISIGPRMDPNDESTLPVRTERISIGPSMDPNDESTLPVRTEQVSVKMPADPDN